MAGGPYFFARHQCTTVANLSSLPLNSVWPIFYIQIRCDLLSHPPPCTFYTAVMLHPVISPNSLVLCSSQQAFSFSFQFSSIHPHPALSSSYLLNLTDKLTMHYCPCPLIHTTFTFICFLDLDSLIYCLHYSFSDVYHLSV